MSTSIVALGAVGALAQEAASDHVQDEIGIGRLSVIPSVRVDHYRLDPDPDQAYRDLNPGALQVGTVTTSNFTVNAGLFNLTDERYWNPQDVTGQSRTSTSIERYAQPGRTVAVNAIVKW